MEKGIPVIQPVIYELDEHGEATGTVHFFCSEACREDAALKAGLVNPGYSRGESDDVPPDTVCENCCKELEPTIPAPSGEFCSGCGHPLDQHVRSVRGTVICLCVWHTSSQRGVIGLAGLRHCDCRNFQSEQARAQQRREQEEQTEYGRAVEKLLEGLPKIGEVPLEPKP